MFWHFCKIFAKYYKEILQEFPAKKWIYKHDVTAYIRLLTTSAEKYNMKNWHFMITFLQYGYS